MCIRFRKKHHPHQFTIQKQLLKKRLSVLIKTISDILLLAVEIVVTIRINAQCTY